MPEIRKVALNGRELMAQTGVEESPPRRGIRRQCLASRFIENTIAQLNFGDEICGSRQMTEDEIKKFWNAHPCGELQYVGLKGDYEEFFSCYDALRYSRERHILRALDRIDFNGKKVLEIGFGQGSDSEQIIRRGGQWSGVDLTPESVARMRIRLQIHQLPYDELECASALALPFISESFDVVFSHGVLHHIPDIGTAQREIARVLKSSGRLIMMVYARRSLNYQLAIKVIRRIALAACYLSQARPGGIVNAHLDNAHKVGLSKYLKMSNFIHRNTDGPLNPYSKVYDLATVRRDFPDFSIERSYQLWMHAPPVPVAWLSPLEGVLGWHLWVHLLPKK